MRARALDMINSSWPSEWDCATPEKHPGSVNLAKVTTPVKCGSASLDSGTLKVGESRLSRGAVGHTLPPYAVRQITQQDCGRTLTLLQNVSHSAGEGLDFLQRRDRFHVQ